MDSQQLINALIEAQRQAGNKPCLLNIHARSLSRTSGPRGIRVIFDPAPPTGIATVHARPTIYIRAVS